MVEELKQAGKAIQSMWTGICNIFGFKDTEDKYGVTNLAEVKLFENLPCRLSFKNINQTNQTESFATSAQVVKLFIAPEVYVPPGSVIEVTQNGVTRKYKHSGISAVYTNHQEIVLEAYKGSA
nr:MAG TPA: head closure knob [Caudoviricetes sp.]